MSRKKPENTGASKTGAKSYWIAKHQLLSFCVLAAAWVWLLYSGALSAPFVYDDISQITNNPALQSWRAVYSHYVLAPASFTSSFLGSGGSNYRPLFWVSLALDAHLWGLDAGGFHFTNLLLHWTNGILLFQLLRKLRLSLLVAALAALVWLGLPINTEAVAWISGRPYLLSTAFLLAALLAALAYVRSGRRLPLLAFFAFALMADLSHEQGVLLLALLALAYLVETEKEPKPWIVLGAGSVLAVVLYIGSRFAVGTHAGDGARTLWCVGLEFWKYIQLIALPIHMSVERSSAVPANWPSFTALIAWAALLGLAVLGNLLRKRAPAVAAGVAVLVVGLLPYCGFVYLYQGMAERFVYLPAAGFVVAGVTAGALAKPSRRQVLLGCLGIWTAWGAWRLVTRVQDWQQPIVLYRNSLEATPNSASLHENLGAALQVAGERPEAETEYRRVTQLLPRDSGAYVNLESLYAEDGRLDDAIAMYKQAISIDPKDATAYFDMGVMFQQRGQDREALAFYKKVLQLKPDDPQTLLYASKLQIAGDKP